MKVLLDTHVVLAVLRRRLADEFPHFALLLSQNGADASASVASLWEIAIKTRLGKLDAGIPLEAVVGFLKTSGIGLLPIEPAHVIAELDPLPPTRDPFDRLLLAQCQVENLRLLTIDRALVGHPLTAQSAP